MNKICKKCQILESQIGRLCKKCINENARIVARSKKGNQIISNLENENWVDVVGYEGLYMVSDQNRLKSNRREIPFVNRWGEKTYRLTNEKLIPIRISKKGYCRVWLSKNNVKKALSFHRIVATAFLENPENLPQVNHIFGNKLDCRPSVLEWCTSSHNQKHAYDTGLNVPKSGFEDTQSKGVKRVFTNEVFGSICIASEYLKIPRTTLSKALRSGKEISRGLFKGETFQYYAHTI